MRDGKWTMEVLDEHGTAQPEHVIDGRTVVESVPGKKFKIRVEFHGDGMHQLELYIDGKSPAFAFDDRRIAEQCSDACAVERRRHDQNTKILAQTLLHV